jgi:hypothetical protein
MWVEVSRLTVVMRQTEERVRVSRGKKKDDKRQGGIGVGKEMRDRLGWEDELKIARVRERNGRPFTLGKNRLEVGLSNRSGVTRGESVGSRVRLSNRSGGARKGSRWLSSRVM